MDLLQRYLRAVEFWLPPGQKQDILAEISEDIHSQIEERQAELGRGLNEAELEALLKLRGRPMLVANRYRPQRSLIGPEWFPTYVFVLKVVGACYVLPWLTVYFIVHRVQHPGSNWGISLLATYSTAQTVAFVAVGIVTLVFASLQLADSRTHFLENWNPRKLPPARDPNKISRANSIAEIVFGLAFLLWWLGYAGTLNPFDGPQFKLTLNPVWMEYFWGCIVVALGNIALAILNLRHPYWSVRRSSWRLACNVAGGGLFFWLIRSEPVASIWIANLDAVRTAAIQHGIQSWIAQSFPLVLILLAVIVAIDVFRIVRVSRREGNGAANGIAASVR
jgi:hypothetical protein